jgi:hypothetical protein
MGAGCIQAEDLAHNGCGLRILDDLPVDPPVALRKDAEKGALAFEIGQVLMGI